MDEQNNIGAPAPRQYKEYKTTPAHRKASKKYYQKQRRVEKEVESGTTWDFVHDLSDEAAKEYLMAAGFHNSKAAEQVVKFAKASAGLNKRHFNRYFLLNGAARCRECEAAGESLPPVEIRTEFVLGEVTHPEDLHLVYIHSKQWRGMSWEDFLASRRQFKKDQMYRGQILGKDFHDRPHKRWAELFIAWDPDLLRPDYTQEDAKHWLDSQSDRKRRLLMACRNSYKSTFAVVWALGGVLCCPDIRLLWISETRALSKAMIEGFRSYWEVKNYFFPTEFQQLFAEFTIDVDEGSGLTFESPMAHLDLINPTAESSSQDSSVAGNRADIITFDDPISNQTVRTLEQRNLSLEKYEAIVELLEVGGYVNLLCTPWHEEDLSATILDRNEKTGQWDFIVDPAWTVKEHAVGMDIYLLGEDDVELLFPTRLTWARLQAKLHDSSSDLRTFRFQTLCEFLPAEDDAHLNFSEDILRKHMHSGGVGDYAPDTSLVCAWDTAHSVSKYSDFSCGMVGRIFNNKDGQPSMNVVDCKMGRFRSSELIREIIDMAVRWPLLTAILIEKPVNQHEAELFAAELNRQAMLMAVTLPRVIWLEVETVKAAKTLRVKALELLLASDRLWFKAGPWIDQLFEQFQRLEIRGGLLKKSRNQIKDDGPDCCTRLCSFIPGALSGDAASELKKREEEQNRLMLEQQHSMIFGPSHIYGKPQPTEASRPDPEPGQNWCWPKRNNQDAPPKTFAYMNDIPRDIPRN